MGKKANIDVGTSPIITAATEVNLYSSNCEARCV